MSHTLLFKPHGTLRRCILLSEVQRVEGPFLVFKFYDLDIFKHYCPIILQNVPQFEFGWCCLMSGFRLSIFIRNATEKMLYSQFISKETQMLICSVSVMLTFFFFFWLHTSFSLVEAPMGFSCGDPQDSCCYLSASLVAVCMGLVAPWHLGS